MDASQQDFSRLLSELSQIGIALSAERDHGRLLEMILTQARDMTGADGGTLYSCTEEKTLKFEIMVSNSLGIFKGGTSGEAIDMPPLQLYDEDGNPNNHAVAAWAALTGETINIEDAYTSEQFDFSGTRKFDQLTGYRSQSFLTVPMTNHENEIIGVLQLINALDPNSGEIRAFSSLDQQLVEALASQAAVAITNQSLIDAQRRLFDSLIQLIANAIDEKSPYTAGHCRRVPVLTNLLADAACHTDFGPLASFDMTDREKYELEVAAWLHDCGKITTPEYVVDKSTKLETIYDRIELVRTRFAVMRQEAENRALRRKLQAAGIDDTDVSSEPTYQAELASMQTNLNIVENSNIGSESISDEDIEYIECIANMTWQNADGEVVRLLSDEEVENLQIGRGTLNAREREVIHNHVSVTIKMLESLPYPKHLKRVPEYAGGHHEKMDGSGYPNGMTRNQMSIPARMVAIADVFEALTAKDRPYKKPMPLSKALRILGQMKVDNHIDGDLFDAFMWNEVYMQYAYEYLEPEQFDTVNLDEIPGYVPPPR